MEFIYCVERRWRRVTVQSPGKRQKNWCIFVTAAMVSNARVLHKARVGMRQVGWHKHTENKISVFLIKCSVCMWIKAGNTEDKVCLGKYPDSVNRAFLCHHFLNQGTSVLLWVIACTVAAQCIVPLSIGNSKFLIPKDQVKYRKNLGKTCKCLETLSIY